MRILKIIWILLLISSVNTYAEKLLHPYNLNFELGVIGLLPEGWYIPVKYEQKGYSAVMNNQEASKGTNCMQLALMAEYVEGNFGTVSQKVDAHHYAGRKIIYKVALKSDLVKDSSECRIWIKSNLEDGTEGTVVTSDSLSSSSEWKYFQIACKIDDNAESFSFGITLIGKGLVLIDDVSLEYDQSNTSGITRDDTPLIEQSLLNLNAFAKIFGFVRYYYPAIELKNYKWEDLALKGSEYIEKSKDTKELIDRLNKLFKPIAPAISITTKSNKKQIKIVKPNNAINNIALSWLHVGADLDIQLKYLRNVLQNIYIPTRAREALSMQIIDASLLRGKNVTFSTWAKASVFEPDGQGQIWLGAESNNNQIIMMETNAKSPIKSSKWEKYSISAKIPEDANVIRLGLVLLGDGNIMFDNPELILDGDTRNFVKNQGFEEYTSFEKVPSWTLPESSLKAGYTITITDKQPYKGNQALIIYSDEESKITMPKEKEVFEDEIIPDIAFQMPLNLYIDSTGTLPKATESEIQPSKPSDFIFNIEDRYSKLSLVILLWNIQKQFGLVNDNELNWDAILKSTLAKIINIKNTEEMVLELNKMLSTINDGQARAWSNDDDLLYALPILWKIIEDKLIITKSKIEEKNIVVGSEVIEINGINFKDVLKKEKESIIGNTENWKDLRALAQLRLGKQGRSPVKVKIVTPSGNTEEHILEFKTPATELTEDRPPQFYKIQENYYYFDLTKITDRGLKNLVAEMKNEFQTSKVMIFDLRGQSSLNEEFLGMFLANTMQSVTRKIPVFVRPNSQPSPYLKFKSEILPQNPKIDAKLLFLVDERTSGMAEIIAGLVKHYKIGTLIGKTTSGTADEIFGISLPGNFNASIVGMKVELEKSKIDFKKGVVPDVFVPLKIDAIINGKDEIFDAINEQLK